MAIKFINQVTKRLNELWNTSLQLTPRELEEGPVQLVNDIGNDLIRSFQGSIYVNIALPVGTVVYQRTDVLAALHSTTPTLGNNPARFILDLNDIEYIEIYNFWASHQISATAGEVYTVGAGVCIEGTSAAALTHRCPIIESGTITISAGGTGNRNTFQSAPEFKKGRIRISSDQISSSVSGGLPMPEQIAPWIFITPPGVMAAQANCTVFFTYQIDLCYKRPYQSIRNNSRSITSY